MSGTISIDTITNQAGINTIDASKVDARIIKVTQFSDTTYNISVSANSSADPITFAFNKENNTSALVVIGHVPVSHQYSHLAGTRIGCQTGTGTINYNYENTLYREAQGNGGGDDHGIGYIQYNARFTSQGSGTNTIYLGWSARDSTQQAPGTRWNPANRSSRSRTHTTSMHIYEIDNSHFTAIT